MIAVDTNLLVYAHRADSEWHDRAAARLRGLAEARAPWAIPWPCIHELPRSACTTASADCGLRTEISDDSPHWTPSTRWQNLRAGEHSKSASPVGRIQ